MSLQDAGRPQRWRSTATVVAAVATMVVMWVLVIGAHSELRSEPPASHPAHALVSSLGGEFAVNIGHSHLENRSSSAHHHEAFTAGVLPGSPGTTFAALGFVVAAVAAVGLLAQLVVSAGRGPPGGFAAALTGQDLLTRFCLSRR
ncbi:hypothetical protein MGAST_14970 [Mycobacterium gastri 'Wayne']|nr:hypothetical protein MGAST_14970 [Mycobacterium gastri 'Wayne']